MGHCVILLINKSLSDRNCHLPSALSQKMKQEPWYREKLARRARIRVSLAFRCSRNEFGTLPSLIFLMVELNKPRSLYYLGLLLRKFVDNFYLFKWDLGIFRVSKYRGIIRPRLGDYVWCHIGRASLRLGAELLDTGAGLCSMWSKIDLSMLLTCRYQQAWQGPVKQDIKTTAFYVYVWSRGMVFLLNGEYAACPMVFTTE